MDGEDPNIRVYKSVVEHHHSNTSVYLSSPSPPYLPIVAVDYCRQLVTVDYCHRFRHVTPHTTPSYNLLRRTTFIRRRYSRRYRPYRPICNRGSLI